MVLRHIPPFVRANRHVNPFTAAAPFMLPMFIMRTIQGMLCLGSDYADRLSVRLRNNVVTLLWRTSRSLPADMHPLSVI